MEIIVGKTAGFCFGVRNAVEKSKKCLEENDTVYCLGELVHNRQVVDKLEKNGLKVIETINEAPDNEKVIIRAHGIAKNIYEEILKKKIDMLDLTCIKVLQIHEIVEEYSNDGFFIIYIGEKNHPETLGTISFAGQNKCIIEEENEIENNIVKIIEQKIEKVLIISQTTFNLEKFIRFSQIIENKLRKNCVIEIKNTVCNATRLRQEETEKIAKSVDCMIIIGGKKSSNTKKLYEISCKNCKIVFNVETKNDLINEIEKLKKFTKIGVMAGASTPQDSIEEIENLLKSI